MTLSQLSPASIEFPELSETTAKPQSHRKGKQSKYDDRRQHALARPKNTKVWRKLVKRNANELILKLGTTRGDMGGGMHASSDGELRRRIVAEVINKVVGDRADYTFQRRMALARSVIRFMTYNKKWTRLKRDAIGVHLTVTVFGDARCDRLMAEAERSVMERRAG